MPIDFGASIGEGIKAAAKTEAKTKAVADVIEKKVPQKGTTLTAADYAKAANYAATDTTPVNDAYMGQAAKDSASGIAIAKKNLEIAKKSGKKSDIALAQAQLDTASKFGSTLNDVLKSMGFDPTTGMSTGGTGALAGNRSDADYVASGSSGTSSTGKHYIDGKPATDEEWATFLKPTGGGGGGNAPAATTTPAAGETSIDLLKSVLKGMGFNPTIIDSSTSFLTNLITEGLNYDNAVQIFLNAKEYTLKDGTKIESPFYKEYGYLNEGLVNPKTSSEIYNAVEGYKGIVDKYQLSQKFIDPNALKKYIQNNVTVADLDERANMARLKAVSADTAQINGLIKLGYISSAKDLTDFYLDPTIGKNQLEQNRITGAFTAEAIRRAQSGITVDAERYKQLGAELTAKGLSETQAAQVASQGFENIAMDFQTVLKNEQIYGGANALTPEEIQKQLEAEQFQGMQSEARRKRAEQAQRAFQASAGTGRYSTSSSSTGAF